MATPTYYTSQFQPVNTFVPDPMNLIAEVAMAKQQAHMQGKQMAENLVDTYYDYYGPEEDYFDKVRGSVEGDVRNLLSSNTDYGSLEFRESLKDIERKYARDPIIRATPINIERYNQSIEELRKQRTSGNTDYNLMDAQDYIQTYQKAGAKGLQEKFGSAAFNAPAIPKYVDYRKELEQYVDDVKPDAMASTVYEGYFRNVSAQSGIEAAKIASAFGVRLTPDGKVDPSSVKAGEGLIQKEAFMGSTAGENLRNNARKMARDYGIDNPEEIEGIVDSLYASTIQSIVNERVFNQAERGKSYDSGYFNSMLRLKAMQQQQEDVRNPFMTTYGQYMGENQNIPEQYKKTYEELSDVEFDEEGNVKLPWWKKAVNTVAATVLASPEAGYSSSDLEDMYNKAAQGRKIDKLAKEHIAEIEKTFPELKELSTIEAKAKAFEGAMKNHSAPVYVDTMFKTLFTDDTGNPVYKDAMVRQASNYIRGFYGEDGVQVVDLKSGKIETASSWENIPEEVKRIKQEDLDRALSTDNIGSIKLNSSDPNVPAVFVINVKDKLIKIPAHNKVQSAYRDVHMLQQAMNNLQPGEYESLSIPGMMYKVDAGFSVDKQNPEKSSFSPSVTIGYRSAETGKFVSTGKIDISTLIQSVNRKLREANYL